MSRSSLTHVEIIGPHGPFRDGTISCRDGLNPKRTVKWKIEHTAVFDSVREALPCAAADRSARGRWGGVNDLDLKDLAISSEKLSLHVLSPRRRRIVPWCKRTMGVGFKDLQSDNWLDPPRRRRRCDATRLGLVSMCRSVPRPDQLELGGPTLIRYSGDGDWAALERLAERLSVQAGEMPRSTGARSCYRVSTGCRAGRDVSNQPRERRIPMWTTEHSIEASAA